MLNLLVGSSSVPSISGNKVDNRSQQIFYNAIFNGVGKIDLNNSRGNWFVIHISILRQPLSNCNDFS